MVAIALPKGDANGDTEASPAAWSKPEGWNGITAYNQVERLTLPLCMNLVQRVNQIRPLDESGAQVFDDGCGTGMLSSVVKRQYPNVALLAADVSEGMLEKFREISRQEQWKNVDTRVLDARDLDSIPDDNFTHTFTTFMICLAPDPDLIARELFRVTKPGGILGLGTWGDPYFSGFARPWKKACRRLIPDYQTPQVAPVEWTYAFEVERSLENVGFKDVEVETMEPPWEFHVDDAMKFWTDGNHPGNNKIKQSFEDRQGSLEEAYPYFKQIIFDTLKIAEDRVAFPIPAVLATARK